VTAHICRHWNLLHKSTNLLLKHFLVIYTVNHKMTPFYFYNNLIKCWPNLTIFGKNVAEKICNIFMLCCSPHLLSVVTLLQENKVPFNYACTCESVPLTAAMLMINVQAEQNHSNSQCLRKCHNLCSKCPPSADTQQRKRLRHSSMASSIIRAVALQTTLQPIADFVPYCISRKF